MPDLTDGHESYEHDPHVHSHPTPETGLDESPAMRGAGTLINLMQFKIEAQEREIQANRMEIDGRTRQAEYLNHENRRLEDKISAYGAVAALVVRMHDAIDNWGEVEVVYKIATTALRELNFQHNNQMESRNVGQTVQGNTLRATPTVPVPGPNPVGLWPSAVGGLGKLDPRRSVK